MQQMEVDLPTECHYMNLSKLDQYMIVREKFLKLPILDMYMVARRGWATGTNRATAVESSARVVRAYHNNQGELSPRTHSDLQRYCADFAKFNNGPGPGESL